MSWLSKQILIRFLILAVLVLALLLAARSEASSWELNELSLDYARYKSDTRDTMLYPVVPKERIDLRVNTEIFTYGFFDSLVHSETAEGQFREVGWNYRIGVRVKYFEFYGEHYSRHMLDTSSPNPFPVENLLGIKWTIYRKN